MKFWLQLTVIFNLGVRKDVGQLKERGRGWGGGIWNLLELLASYLNSICFSILLAVTTLTSFPVDRRCNSRLEDIICVVISVSAAVPAPQQLTKGRSDSSNRLGVKSTNWYLNRRILTKDVTHNYTTEGWKGESLWWLYTSNNGGTRQYRNVRTINVFLTLNQILKQ